MNKPVGTTRPRHAAKKMASGGRLICIGTHHKTGTVWMRKVWQHIAAEQNIPFMPIYRPRKMAAIPEKGPCILVNWNSAFPQQLMDHPEARFLHVIRDPRDVLLSGMRYHRIAGLRNEKALREPREDLGGLNYQEHLNALPNDSERLRFEMHNRHHETLTQMLAWNYRHPHSVELNYEDMMEDEDCQVFRKALTKMDIAGLDIEAAVKTYWDLALFGGLTDPKTVAVPSAHIGSGKPTQWVTNLPAEIAEEYAAEYGNALKQLKYETSLKWVSACKPAAEIQLTS